VVTSSATDRGFGRAVSRERRTRLAAARLVGGRLQRFDSPRIAEIFDGGFACLLMVDVPDNAWEWRIAAGPDRVGPRAARAAGSFV
jgi:hypothetical protein